MTELTALLNTIEQRIRADEQGLQSALLAWARSGARARPTSLSRAYDLLATDLQRFEILATQLAPDNDTEKRARNLLIEACTEAVRGIHTFQLSVGATNDLNAQARGFNEAKKLMGSAAAQYENARKAAGCRKTC
jgi:hypothetical protein